MSESTVPSQDPSNSAIAKPSLLRRLAGAFDDPVLRALAISTAVARGGGGVFFAITILFFTQVIGLSAVQAALVFSISSGCAVVASFVGGWLADRWSARRLAAIFEVGSGLMLGIYAFTNSFASALTVAILAQILSTLGHSARSAIIARGFAAESRVHARAVLRTVTNLALAVGAGLAAIAIAVGTPEAYRLVIVLAALVCACGAIPLFRLPARVDASSPVIQDVHTETGSIDTVTTAEAKRVAQVDWRKRSPWRDPRYLALTLLAAIFGMQFGVYEVGVPLWIIEHTTAPQTLVAVLLILNTALVVLFQVRLSRGTHDVRYAGRVTMIAGWLMAGACLVYGLAAGVPTWVAIMILITGAVLHTFAEVLSQGGAWGLSFELADHVRAGAYQGVFGMGYSLGALSSPLLVNATAITFGMPGWVILAAIFLAAAFGIWMIARKATVSAVVPSPAI